MNNDEDEYREKNPKALLSHDITMRKSSRTSRTSRLNLSSDAFFNMHALAFGIQRIGVGSHDVADQRAGLDENQTIQSVTSRSSVWASGSFSACSMPKTLAK
jgi:hypothetical protein